MSELPKRVLLKISGEALAGLQPDDDKKTGIDQKMLQKLASDIKQVYDLGIQVCLVVGGGNIYRGISGMESYDIDRSTGDYMGMLATVINGMALRSVIEKTGINCRMMTAIPMPLVSESYTYNQAVRHLEKGRVVLFVGGTGNPFFTTDTAAALRACEMKCDLLLKATKVKGVYTSDPAKDKSAVFLERLTYATVIERNLNVMDTAAISLMRDTSIPVAVFSIYEDEGFQKVVTGKTQFTLISHTD